MNETAVLTTLLCSYSRRETLEDEWSQNLQQMTRLAADLPSDTLLLPLSAVLFVRRKRPSLKFTDAK